MCVYIKNSNRIDLSSSHYRRLCCKDPDGYEAVGMLFDQNTAEIVSQACNSGKTQIKMRVTPYRGGAKCLEIIE